MTTIDPDRARIDDLIAARARGDRTKLLMFWGHTPQRPDVVDKACLSQWYDAPFVVDGQRFATAEHWMMHGKAKLFGDDDIAARVLADDRPAVVKKLGREVQGFDDARWRAHRFELITQGSLHKFRQHAALREWLLATGDLVLVEASPTDTIWGIGLAAASPEANDPSTWRGLNLLGFALMAARSQLRAEVGA